MNLKAQVEKFEERVTVKIIIERIIKALLKSKIFIVSDLFAVMDGLVSEITSLSMFLIMRPESLLLA